MRCTGAKVFLWMSIWKVMIPKKAGFCHGQQLLGRVWLGITFEEGRFILNRCFKCRNMGMFFHCRNPEEGGFIYFSWITALGMAYFFFLYCEFIREIRRGIFNCLVCCGWCLSRCGVLQDWNGLTHRRAQVIWDMITYFLWWTIWRVRNKRYFEAVEKSSLYVRSLCFFFPLSKQSLFGFCCILYRLLCETFLGRGVGDLVQVFFIVALTDQSLFLLLGGSACFLYTPC